MICWSCAVVWLASGPARLDRAYLCRLADANYRTQEDQLRQLGLQADAAKIAFCFYCFVGPVPAAYLRTKRIGAEIGSAERDADRRDCSRHCNSEKGPAKEVLHTAEHTTRLSGSLAYLMHFLNIQAKSSLLPTA